MVITTTHINNAGIVKGNRLHVDSKGAILSHHEVKSGSRLDQRVVEVHQGQLRHGFAQGLSPFSGQHSR